MLYVQKGKYEEAIAEIEKIPQAKANVFLAALRARACYRSGQMDKAHDALTWLQKRSKQYPEALFHLATVYGDLGRRDEAFECLNRDYEERDDRLLWIKTDPRVDSLRSDPWLDELLRKMKLK
jgi:tetratricopeptide (TPR) repeat protein